MISAELAPKVVQETGELCPECERPLIRRFGRFGPFFACTRLPGVPLHASGRRPGRGRGDGREVRRLRLGDGRQARPLRRLPAPARSYPECKGTKPLLQKTGVPCPLDGGEIVERTTRKKRKFYGCVNYPKCEFTSWQRPLPQVCPQCGGLIVARRAAAARKCTELRLEGPGHRRPGSGTTRAEGRRRRAA